MAELSRILASAAACDQRGERYLLATVVGVRGSSYRRPGARLLVPETGPTAGVISGGCLEADAARMARESLDAAAPRLITVDHSQEGDEIWGSGLGCRGIIDLVVEPPELARDTVATLAQVTADRASRVLVTRVGSEDAERRVLGPHQAASIGPGVGEAVHHGRPLLVGDLLVDAILPPLRLVICGAGPDAAGLAAQALQLGWDVAVTDPRRRMLTADRFPGTTLHDLEPAGAGEIPLDARSAVVVMSHDFLRDQAYVRALGVHDAFYLGVLGPRERTERLLAEAPDAARDELHAPAGLDLGADGPEEVAVAIVAEIIAALHGATGGPLRDRSGPIHAEPAQPPM